MADVPFTQYLRPYGRTVRVSIDRPEAVAAKAAALLAEGFRLECEELTTGDVSFTICGSDDDYDLAIEIVPNGPDVPAAVDRLILNFDPKGEGL